MSIGATQHRHPDVRIVGDTEMTIACDLVDDDNTLMDLTGATATFAYRLVDGTVLSSELACTVSSSGTVVYEPSPSDTFVTTAGQYVGRFKLTLSDGKIMKWAVQLESVDEI